MGYFNKAQHTYQQPVDKGKQQYEKKELFDMGREIGALFPNYKQFIGRMLVLGKNKRAIALALRQLRMASPCPKNPWAYCLKIVNVESGNYNEREHIEKQEPLTPQQARDILKEILER